MLGDEKNIHSWKNVRTFLLIITMAKSRFVFLIVFFSLIKIHTKISIYTVFFWCLSGDSVLHPSVHVETVGRWQNQDVGEWTSQAYHWWRRAKGSKEFAHQLLHSQHPQTHSLCLQVHLLRGSQFRQRHRADLLNWFVSWKSFQNLPVFSQDPFIGIAILSVKKSILRPWHNKWKNKREE